MYTNELADFVITSIITFIDFSCRSSLAILKILRVLRTLIALKAPFYAPPLAAVKTISRILKETTLPSSQFILSLRYFTIPSAITFDDISTIKIQVNNSPA